MARGMKLNHTPKTREKGLILPVSKREMCEEATHKTPVKHHLLASENLRNEFN